LPSQPHAGLLNVRKANISELGFLVFHSPYLCESLYGLLEGFREINLEKSHNWDKEKTVYAFATAPKPEISTAISALL
jgi:hypothetical protein